MVAPLNKLISEFLDRGEPVYKTRDWHPAKTKHFQAFGGIWPVHCVQETRGSEFHEDLSADPRADDRLERNGRKRGRILRDSTAQTWPN
mgnify:CR=1 FL=1